VLWIHLPAALGDAPITLTREQAAELAREELADPAYHAAQEPLPLRVAGWLVDQVQQVVDRLGAATPGGWYGLLGLVVVAVAVLAVVRWRIGPVQRSARSVALFDSVEPVASAAEHRNRAEVAAAGGDLATAVRERLRAVVRDLQQRDVVDDGPGRTADETAAAAGVRLPTVAADLRDGARRFDEVWYGDRPATRQDYDALVRLDEAVATARPTAVPG
jgi:Domain of unknown function (DUF4129)